MRERSPKVLLLVAIVAGAVFFAHFARFRDFGLYEDDYWSIAPHLDDPPGKLWGLLVKDFREWPTGRPLNYFLPAALSIVGSRVGGLQGVYALAAAWLVANGVLVFLIARRLLSPAAGLVAAMVYVLFPADSTKILLVHAAHVQGAMTFLLLGIWLWMTGGRARVASYPVAALALLSYETAFLPFLAAPLLRAAARRTTLRIWAVHVGSCVGVGALVGAIRLSTGDARAATAIQQPGESLYRIATSLYLGPLTSGRLLLDGAFAGARQLDAAAWLAIAIASVGLGAVARPDSSPGGSSVPAASAASPSGLVTSGEHLAWWWLFAGGLAVWSGSYGLTLVNYPPTQTIGRATSTHVAAAWPACLAIAAAFEGARRRGKRWCRTAVVLAAIWTAGVIGYHRELQRQYVRSWEVQRDFWRQVMTLVPEAGPGWSVIVDGPPAERGRAIAANSWSDYLVYRLIFRRGFDAMNGFDATGPDFAHLGNLGDLVPFRRAGDLVEWKPQFYSGNFVPIDPARLALLVDDRGALRRVPELATPVGKLAAAPAAPTPPGAIRPSTPVARLLFPDRAP